MHVAGSLFVAGSSAQSSSGHFTFPPLLLVHEVHGDLLLRANVELRSSPIKLSSNLNFYILWGVQKEGGQGSLSVAPVPLQSLTFLPGSFCETETCLRAKFCNNTPVTIICTWVSC